MIPDDGTEGPPRWLLALERAHALSQKAGRVLENVPASGADLGPAARSIEAAVGAIYTAFDARDDRFEATRHAGAELDVAAMVLNSLRAVDPSLSDAAALLREARGVLGVAEERFSRVPPEREQPAAELRASKGTPAIHQIPRASILPVLRVAATIAPPPPPRPPPPRPKSLEELAGTMAEVRRHLASQRKAREEREEERKQARAAKEAALSAEPPPGFAKGAFAAKSDDDLLATRTRECFEEVAMIGMQRAPLLGDPWRSAKIVEDRMLAAIDAIAALGPSSLERLEPLLLDAPTKDPARGFAITMILGCFDGRDALGAVERALHRLGPADPEVAANVGGALKLIPHPSLSLFLRTLLADADPACRALAIDVLAYRGMATTRELIAAAQDPSPAVMAAALPALGLHRPPELGPLIEAAREHSEPAVREAAWAAMAHSGHPLAADVLAGEIEGPLAARAAVPLAIVGDDRDAARLLERMRADPTSALVNAVGWAGLTESIPALMELLSHEDPVVQLSAAYALDRITGARLYEDVEVSPEAIMVPDVEEPAVGEPSNEPRRLAQAVSDPRDRPSEGANETTRQPAVRVERWQAYFAEKGPDYKPNTKYRRGSPYTPTVSLWELDAWPLTPGERRWLMRELVVRTGQFVRFDPHDFVAVQEEALAAWAPIAQRMSGSSGAWGVPMRR